MTSQELTLYGHPISPFSYLIHFALLHREIQHKFVCVNMSAKEHKSPEYLKLNPLGLIPALQVGEQSIFSSWAIFEYLEENYNSKRMLPSEEPYRSLVRSLCLTAITEMGKIGRELFLYSLGRKVIPKEEVSELIKEMQRLLAIFESELPKIPNHFHPTPVHPLLFLVWKNLSYSVPDLDTDFPFLSCTLKDFETLAPVQTIEKDPITQMVRDVFKNLINKQKTQS
ncbi:MAG TPA: glutathione S-transferase family protein [Vampirovibrionales bacterium]